MQPVVLHQAVELLCRLKFGSPPAEAEIRPFTSSQQCRECHPEVYAEWEASWHSRSYVDPLVRAPDQSNDYANTDCLDCHAPREVFITGMGERALRHEPANAGDRAAMAEIAAAGVRAGALGFSTSRTINHRTLAGEHTPTLKAQADELIEIGTYRGMRHRRGLPVRGQRTRTNARTRKGKKKTVAGRKRALRKT